MFFYLLEKWTACYKMLILNYLYGNIIGMYCISMGPLGDGCCYVYVALDVVASDGSVQV